MLLQTIFDEWGEKIKIAWETADPVEIWGWIIFSIGIACVFLLIFFMEYKRQERDSIKFSVITMVIASISLGFGLHMILIANGLW
jgi:hypothetical protein